MQYVTSRRIKRIGTFCASASDRQARNSFYDARNPVHSVTDQIANTWEIFGFNHGDDVERPRDGIDSFHHCDVFECLDHVGCFADGCFDKNVCTCSQTISPLTSGAIIFGLEQGCQSQILTVRLALYRRTNNSL